MATLKFSMPTHLSIFVTDPDTGRPVARLPLYAEVAVPRIVPGPPINERFREPMRAALFDVDPTATDTAVRDRVETAALQALAETVDEASRNQLVTRPERVKELFHRVFKVVLDAANRERMADIPPANLKSLIVAALRRVAPELDLGLVPEVEDFGIIWADPLGVLTTDHVGYVSFDLRRLRPDVQVLLAEAIEARRNDPDAVSKLAIWVYPYGHPGRFDALSQARFAFDAVVARLSMTWNTLPPALINMGPRALQNPSLTDWRLSPASFAASPKTLIGENGCEELVPANLALQEFVLRQVVRLTDVPQGFGVPAGIKAAYVDEYKVSWFSLGHSLGEILYSLPLAPGETVKLAVIDWSWDSLTKRDETTKLTEEVLHQTHRDRTITETVKAGLKELQHGSSFMGGTASAAGGSGGANLGVVGLGAAVGNTWSLGGSTATSDGSRDLAAENVQRLNDSFSQASSSQRELNSTVVIQARQEEKESIQTRTFSNYNHSHTLTVLYYEVLRHYRVTVEWVRRRPAVLLKLPTRLTTLDDATLVKHRFLLERFLLDPTIKAGFDALEKREAIANHQTIHGINPAAAVPQPWWEGDVELELFELCLRAPDDTVNEIVVYIITAGDHANSKARELHYVYKGVSNADGKYQAHNINSGKRMETNDAENTNQYWTFLKLAGQPNDGESKRIKWNDVLGFQFEKWGETQYRIDLLAIRGWDRFGFVVNFTEGKVPEGKVPVDLYIDDVQPGSTTFSDIKRPGPRPAPPAPVLSPDKSLSAEEAYQLKRLRDHVAAHIDHYASVIQLGTNETQIALQFEAVPWAPGTMDDHVDPTPLDVFGSYVAYPLAKRLTGVDDTVVVDIAAALNGNDPARRQWAAERLAAMSEADRQSVLERLPLASAKSERLNSMATRGVFAEGKLGHCNVSEEIDNTRFWKWEEHPIPIQAPDINPVTPIQPTPQQVSATPTAFPQSLVNIVNPSPAPDPTGLAAALSLLGTPNIFRNMSGRQEVADLLKKLSDNSIAIAEAANRAREIQGKYGSNLQGIGGGGGSGSGDASQAGSPRVRPTEPSIASGGLQHARKELQAAQRDNLVTQEESEELYKGAARLAFGLDAETVESAGGMGESSVSPFSELLYATEMRPSATHNARLTTAMQTVRATLSDANKERLDNVSIIVVKLTPSGNMDYAGVRETDMYFSGSLLKVALLYASFELVARVNKLAPRITAGSASDFFVKVNQDFESKIAKAVPKIPSGAWRKVQFDKALTATADASGTFRVTMSPRHDQDLRSIFLNQNQNVGAQECMHRLGFSYVNGALEAAGFFGLVAQTGIWMATDYIKDDPPDPGNWPSFDVPVVTNGTSSAAMTTLTMANLLTKVHRRELIDAASSQTMRDIFATGGAWLATLANPNAFSFAADGAKVGHSASASAKVSSVMSEAVFLKRKSDSAPFAAVWQNVPDPLGAEPIYKVIDEVVKNWP
jgi:hypothetical protein